MAKGNIILGYLRGSIGDITFYRAKGQQMSRARNRQPANPRTEPQIATRSRLANAVKFFRQVDTGFFKYAFEDRKNNESDYNAFMRHNLQESGYIGAQASKIFSWPALGIWQMSEGTLPEIGAPFPQPQDAGTSIYFDLGVTLDDSTSTVANLSNLLISGNRNVWRSGDIVTVVIYRATNRATLPTIDVTETHEVSCGVIQFRLNSSDQRDLNDLTADVGGVTYALGYDSDGFFIYGLDSAGATAWNNDYLGFSVIHSRNTDKGLKVSRSYLASPSWEIAVIAGSQSTQYYQDVLADWGAASTAILQGAAATGSDDVIEWAATSAGPYGTTIIQQSIAGAVPTEETLFVKFSSASAAAAGINLITAYGSGGGSVDIIKTIDGAIVEVSCVITLTNTSSTATVRVGSATAAIYTRSA